jgi:signal transduction histidine kinase/ActR/RegA family two-component response regulator
VTFLTLWAQVGRRVTVTPRLAIGLAVILLGGGLGLAVLNEHISLIEHQNNARTQANILAASLAAPLAFDDQAAMREYINALRADPEVQAVGAYGADGRLATGYALVGKPLQPTNSDPSPSAHNNSLEVRAPVSQGNTPLGSVYLRTSIETLARRATRYVGIGILIFMASLLVAVLGAGHASLSEANRRLKREMEEREKAEAALRQAQKMEAMGQLTGGVAHDFNNLLMVASSGLDLMEKTSDPARRERLKGAIRQAIDRGASLTQQLLAFARRAPLKPEIVDLNVLLRGMREMLDRTLREDIIVHLDPAPDIWPVEIDSSQLEVAILNAAVNARDAMPNGGSITVSADNKPAGGPSERDLVQISIRDTGSGMPPDVLARVFEPFFTTKEVGKGTGLGLSQVYGFAHASGGEVQIDSAPGSGTTVSLLLPRSEKLAATQHRSDYNVSTSTTQHTKILVVEDDDNVAGLVLEMLNVLGYDPLRTSNAERALEALRSEVQFDIVFSDMVMPGDMNGLDLVHQIVRDYPDLPVVLTTGYSAAASSAAAEGVRLLLKPYRIEALDTALKDALAQRPAETQVPLG